ncbi:MAG: DUF3000 domain-containing protein [Propionibacteriaceae bacterium]
MPAAFERATSALAQMSWRPEVHIEEIPAPQRIAPFSAAITADVLMDSDEVGSGRLVLLHDPGGNDAWQGTFRCVSFVRAEVDPEMVTDPLLASVGWSWLVDALTSLDATYGEPSGTVTSVSSQSFGGMADDPSRAEVEVRASWTPLLEADGSGLESHLRAWGELLCTTAGLPPLPPGVIPMPARRGAGPGHRRR